LSVLAKRDRRACALLWIIAAVLVRAGILTFFRGGVPAGILLFVLGFAVGPGGWSIFH